MSHQAFVKVNPLDSRLLITHHTEKSVINLLFKLSLIAFFSILVFGCAIPNNARTASNYYQQGIDAEMDDDFLAARQAYKKAYIYIEIGKLGDKPSAYALYEWSRVSGYLKSYDKAEEGFRNTLKLIDKAAPVANQLKPPALSELARLLNNTNQHEKAVPIFKQAIEALNNAQIVQEDPIGFADFLDLYAQSLEQIGSAAHFDISEKIQRIKMQHPNAKAKFIYRDY